MSVWAHGDLLIWPHHPIAENLKFVILYPRGGTILVACCVKTYMHASLVIPIVRSPKNITIHLSSYSPIGKNDTLSLGGKKMSFFSDQTISFYIYHQHTYIKFIF